MDRRPRSRGAPVPKKALPRQADWAHSGLNGGSALSLELVLSGRLQAAKLVTHRFGLADAMKAYDTFGDAAHERALKVGLRSA
jgi:threonine dehydrogenase-like Zn-dependent dehydrogenase